MKHLISILFLLLAVALPGIASGQTLEDIRAARAAACAVSTTGDTCRLMMETETQMLREELAKSSSKQSQPTPPAAPQQAPNAAAVTTTVTTTSQPVVAQPAPSLSLVMGVDTRAPDSVRCVIGVPASNWTIRNRSSVPEEVIYGGTSVPIVGLTGEVQAAVVWNQGDEEPHSVLMPGQTCVMQVPYSVSTVGWKVQVIGYKPVNPYKTTTGLRPDSTASAMLVRCAQSRALLLNGNMAFGQTEGIVCQN